jgi:cysteine desulfurase / selenocysteine lyase
LVLLLWGDGGVMTGVYLNNAASSWPKAPGVIEAMSGALAAPPVHPGRAAMRDDPTAACRARLATLLGDDVGRPSANAPTAERIVLTASATHALNLAILGLDLEPGASVVTTVTEHNSVLRPLNHLAQRRGIRVQTVGLDASGCIDARAWAAALESRPRLAVLSHASNVTGRIADAARLLGQARAAGSVTLLDAAQTLGHVPVNAEALNADLVAFTGHKALHGPPGTGGLYVAPRVALSQWFVGGTGVRSDLALHPTDMPTRLEAGTPNVPALAGLAAALVWSAQDRAGRRDQVQRLTARLRAGLRSTPRVRLFGDGPEHESTGILSFAVADWSIEEAGFVLSESFGIACRTGLHCAPLIHAPLGCAPAGTIRFSVSSFNTDDDIEAALRAVERLASKRRMAA